MTQADFQHRIVQLLGAQLLGGPQPDRLTAQMMEGLTHEVPFLWQLHSDKAPVYLQYLYTLVDAILMLQGQMRGKADAWLGRALRLQYRQKFAALVEMYKEVSATLTAYVDSFGAWGGPGWGSGGPAVGALSATYPGADTTAAAVMTYSGNITLVNVPTTVPLPNPNDPFYGGWPLSPPIDRVRA
jgi:hypothetical protein